MNHLLSTAKYLRTFHPNWKEHSRNRHNQWLHDVKVIHVHIIAYHVIVARNVR